MAYLYTWNPNNWTWDDLQEGIYRVNNGIEYDRMWSCGNTKRIKIGELCFLMKLGVEPKGIIGCGYISSLPYPFPHWDNVKAQEGQSALRTDVLFKALSEKPIISLADLENKYPDYRWTPQASGVSIPGEIANELFEFIQGSKKFSFPKADANEIERFTEGKPKFITIKNYDRSSGARLECIKYYGYDCSVCGFNFKNTYGDIGNECIEVHHLKPVSDFDDEHEIDPISDLRPVCANCHRMLHKTKPPLSIKELRAIICAMK